MLPHWGAWGSRGGSPRPAMLPGCVSHSSAWCRHASFKAAAKHLLCSPTHSSTSLINQSPLLWPLNKSNMASRCEPQGLEMYVVNG